MKYSVVVPIYNDAYLARPLCEELVRVLETLTPVRPLRHAMELLFINDGSKNDSLDTLRQLVKEFDMVRVIDLSRNFGQHQAIACGFKEARGDIVIRMNVDMQDPPAELPKLLAVMAQDDADLVVGQYTTRKSPLKDKLTSAIYFSCFRFLTGLEVPHNTSPMRAMSRRFITAYNTLTEKSRFPQGLDCWLGFRQRTVPIEHRARADKKSSYTFTKRLALAFNGIVYFSDRPIKLVTAFGFIVACFGLALGLSIVANKIAGTEYLPGYASLAAMGLITFGIQLTSLGIIGLYVGKIFKEVQNRPLYVVRETYSNEATHG